MRATPEEHSEYHYLHCCMSSFELGASMVGGGPYTRQQLRVMLAGMRSDCPDCQRLGWSGWEAFG